MVQYLKNITFISLFLVINTLTAQQLQYQNHEMEYDDLNRLTKVFFSNGIVHEYVYDNLGNRLERMVYEAPKTYVPDDAFEQHLIDEGYDVVMDDYVFTHRIDDIEDLFLENLGIADLTGIEDFIGLKSLTANINQLTSIDVTQNINLEILYVSNNNIDAIDVTQNSQLKFLELNDNNITELDITQNPLLEVLTIQNTHVTALDFNNTPLFKRLYAANASLVNLDFSATPQLELLFLGNNNLESLNVENNNNNILVDFYTEGNPNLFCIQVDDDDDANNGIGVYANWDTDAQIQYSYNCNLTYVPDDAFEQRLIDLGYDVVLNDYVVTAEIDDITFLSATSLGIQDATGIEDFTDIEILYFNYNDIETIDLSQNTQLRVFQIGENNLTSVNVTNNTLLESLTIGDNQLTSLDITNNPDLFFLSCDNNQLTELDISNNINLGLLNAHYNNISNLDVSQNSNLSYIWIRNNPIESLDFSNNPNLDEVNARNCGDLVALNLKNGNNTILDTVLTQNSPNLYCIQVDDEDAANNGTGVYGSWNTDSQVEYSENCDSFFNIDYLLQVTSLTCINSQDGIIEISTENDAFDYGVNITSAENNYDQTFSLANFNNRFLSVFNLNAGEYIIDITIDGISEDFYKKTYILNVLEVQPLEETWSGNPSGRMVSINSGTSPFSVTVNGQVVLVTNETTFIFQANHGDLVEITTAIACEGKSQRVINDIDGITMYPNPTDGRLIFVTTQDFGNTQSSVLIQFFDINGRLVKSKSYEIQNSRIEVNIEDLSSGTYFAKLENISNRTFKIIKE